ncbi:MAG: catalase [Comamonadaceae bacterium]|nr:MAG: catalase [Comamonadaceae bacterium]
MVKKSQPSATKTAESAPLAAARAAARNTDSGPAQPAPPEATQGDLPAQKAADAQALAAAQPHNAAKPAEYEGGAQPPVPAGQAVPPPSPLATASTLSELSVNAKAGTSAAPGANPLVGSLDRVRVDATGQRLTTNQGVPIADNQNSLKAGSRGPALLEDFILREKITHFDHERIPERIVHARGSAAHGFFECYEPLHSLTRAAPFQEAGKITPVFVRFSTVAGERGSKDTARDVRGFAVKFYTDEGNWDLVGNNMPVFFIQDAMKFPDLVHAVKPEPHHAMPQAASAHDTFWDFVGLMPESTHMLMWQMSDRAIPRSYRTMQGFGVHTFRMVNAEGESRFVKFHWQPKLGTHSLVWDEAVKISGADPDYHRRDLWEAIEAGEYPEWELGLQVFTEEMAESFSFDVLDATKIVPEELVPIQLVGRMVLNRNPDNFFAETEQVAFCTAHIVPGLDFSNDPLLAGRIHSYVDTQISRLGGPNFHELPINAPIAPVHNNQRDGMHRQAIHRGRVSYEPNSLGGGCPFQAGAGQGFESVRSRQEAQETRDKVRIKPEKFADHYTQAKLFFDSQSPVEQAHIAAAFRFELSKVTVPAVRERVVAGLRNASEDLAAQVAAGLGMELPAPLPLAAATVAEPEVRTSPALSLLARAGQGGIRTRKIAVLVADGIDGASVQSLVEMLFNAGAVPRLVAPRLGAVKTADGLVLQADASLENAPGFLFDAIVLPDGPDGVARLSRMGQTMEFVKDQYRHCKPLLVLGASQGLLAQAEIPLALPDGRPDSGLILGDVSDLPALSAAFAMAIEKHRHFERDQDPPLV